MRLIRAVECYMCAIIFDVIIFDQKYCHNVLVYDLVAIAEFLVNCLV